MLEIVILAECLNSNNLLVMNILPPEAYLYLDPSVVLGTNVFYLVIDHSYYVTILYVMKSNRIYNNQLTVYLKKLIFE